MRKEWSVEEIALLKANYGKIGTDEMANKLGRSLVSTRRKIDNMGLRGGLRKKWSKFEIDLLEANKDKAKEEIIKALPDRGWPSIVSRLNKLAVK